MPRYIRSMVPGVTYFFTVTLADRSSDLLVREIECLRHAYRAVQRRHPYESVAICVLPDHLHAVWKLPEGDTDYGLRWQQVKRAFSTPVDDVGVLSCSKRSKRERGLWQRRFWEHRIRDEEDFARHVEYIHFNPVKHGHVQQVQDWPYSSFHRWVRRGDVPASWGLVQAADGGRYGE